MVMGYGIVVFLKDVKYYSDLIFIKHNEDKMKEFLTPTHKDKCEELENELWRICAINKKIKTKKNLVLENNLIK